MLQAIHVHKSVVQIAKGATTALLNLQGSQSYGGNKAVLVVGMAVKDILDVFRGQLMTAAMGLHISAAPRTHAQRNRAGFGRNVLSGPIEEEKITKLLATI